MTDGCCSCHGLNMAVSRLDSNGSECLMLQGKRLLATLRPPKLPLKKRRKERIRITSRMPVTARPFVPSGNPLRFLPDELEDVGIVLLECGIRGSHAPQCDSDDVDGDFAGDTHQWVSLLDHLPMRTRNSSNPYGSL